MSVNGNLGFTIRSWIVQLSPGHALQEKEHHEREVLSYIPPIPNQRMNETLSYE